MHVTQTLPEGSEHLLRIDLQRDRRIAIRVNVIGTLIMAVMAVAFHFLAVPFDRFLGPMDRLLPVLLHAAVMLTGYASYIILHELTHAAVMKAFGARSVRFGFTGLYAYAGSNVDYFNRVPYLLIAMAPMITWGILFGIAQCFVPEDWAWTVWFLQIGNIAGSVGDLYVSCRFAFIPSSILIRDTGLAMDVYALPRHDNN